MGKISSLLAIIFVNIIFVSSIIYFPYPELFIYPYLTNIGLKPYTQIFDQHFPGLMFLPVNLASMGIDTPHEMLILHIFVLIAIHLLIYLITNSLLKDRKTIIANLFFLVWQPYVEGGTLWIDTFIPLLLLPASYWIYKKKYSISGFLVGLALVLKQVILPISAALGLYLLYFNGFKSFKKFVLWFLLPPVLMIFYIYKLGALPDFYYWTITFNLTTFAQMGRKYASFSEIVKFLVIFSPAIIISLHAFVKKSKMMPFAIFFMGCLVFAYARFDLVHLQPALPFAAILIGYYLGRFDGKLSKNVIFLYLILGTLVLSPYLTALKSDQVRFFGSKEKELSQKVKAYANNGDTIFVMGTTPHLYYLTNTRPPGDVFVFQFPWFMVEAEGRVLEGLASDPPKVVARDATATTGGVNLVQYMPDVRKFVEDNYEVADNVDEIELLIPKK